MIVVNLKAYLIIRINLISIFIIIQYTLFFSFIIKAVDAIKLSIIIDLIAHF